MSWQEFLGEQGFKQYPNSRIDHEFADTSWQKRVTWQPVNPDSGEQEDTFIGVYQYDDASAETGVSFQIDCTFERGDRHSMRVELYTFREDELLAQLPAVVDELVALRRSVAVQCFQNVVRASVGS